MSASPGIRVRVPPQHGAWAFLVVPLVFGAALGAATPIGLAFSIAWISAYPTTYFAGRSIVGRLRRGSWDTVARREARSALPWALVTAAGAAPLLVARPWIVAPGAACGALWAASVALTRAGRERGITNDMVLVALASLATPLMWTVSADHPSVGAIPGDVWEAAVVCLAFFTGSVLHVKSLIREADDRRWHLASVAFHMVVLVTSVYLSVWFALPFGVALARTLALRPGTRPARIGAIEIVVSTLVIAGTLLAIG